MIIATVLILAIAQISVLMAGEIKLTGRVLTHTIYMPTEGSSRSQEFIFGVESKDRRGNDVVTPVVIHCYSCVRPDPIKSLPEDFFDYSKKYELSVVEENREIPFKDIAYDMLFKSNGKPVSFAGFDSLPRVIILDGVPESILKIGMDIMLPKYELPANKYKIIKEKPKK